MLTEKGLDITIYIKEYNTLNHLEFHLKVLNSEGILFYPNSLALPKFSGNHSKQNSFEIGIEEEY